MSNTPTTARAALAGWRKSLPTTGFTWGIALSGDSFVNVLQQWCGEFHGGLRLLEVGPGYGRVLATILDRRLPFGDYCGIDLSPANIDFLRERFPDPRTAFLCGDVCQAHPTGPWHVIFATTVFHHLYPSFQPAAACLADSAVMGGFLVFDVPEGKARRSDALVRRRRCYFRRYARNEIKAILRQAGWRVVAFDRLKNHKNDIVRLVVIAKRA